MNDDSWHVVKETAKVTGFVGGNNPFPIPDEEVAKITKRMEEGAEKPRPKVLFEVGETVRVIDGPFLNFSGVVEDVKPDKGQAEGHGEHLRPRDAGRARIHAGRKAVGATRC